MKNKNMKYIKLHYSLDSFLSIFLVYVFLYLLSFLYTISLDDVNNLFLIFTQIMFFCFLALLFFRRYGLRLNSIEKDKDRYKVRYTSLFKQKELCVKEISIEVNKSPLVYFDKIKKGTIRYKLKMDKKNMSLESSLFDVIPLINFLNTNSCSVELSKSFKDNLRELKKNNHFQDYHVMIDEILGSGSILN